MDNEILLSRCIQQNFLWSDKPFSMGQAWIDLLMLAEWKDKDVVSKGEVIHLKRGQVGRAILWLSDRWGWNRKKTTRFLKILEMQKMATIESTTKGTTITIENYDKYQFAGTTVGTTEGTTMGQPWDTTKEGKEGKEIIKIPTVSHKEDYQKIIDMYHEECPSLPAVRVLTDERKKKIKARLSKHSEDEIRLAFQKAEASDFFTGRNGDWNGSFDWIMKSETNIVKILEGNYDNKDSARQKAIRDLGSMDMSQEQYEDMERRFG